MTKTKIQKPSKSQNEFVEQNNSKHIILKRYEKIAFETPILKRPDELELLKVCKNADSSEKEAGAAQEKIINAYLRTVLAVSRKYTNNTNLDIIDAIHSGIVGICKAINEFDMEQYKKLGSLFSYYCYRGILMEVNDFYRLNLRQVGVSDTTNTKLHKINKLYKSGDLNTRMEHGEIVEIVKKHLEMKDSADFKVENLLNLFKSGVSLDAAPENFEGESGDFRDLILQKFESKNPATIHEINDRNDHLMEKLNELPADERNIIFHRYGINNCEKSTFADLAARYKINGNSARNKIEKIQEKLKKSLSFCGRITSSPDFSKSLETESI